jgi:glycosyltransferase involved in cell wall biosynthesis
MAHAVWPKRNKVSQSYDLAPPSVIHHHAKVIHHLLQPNCAGNTGCFRCSHHARLISWSALGFVAQMQTVHLDRDLIPPSRETCAGAPTAWPLATPRFAKTPKERIAFLYLGRRGGIARLAYELGVAAVHHPKIDPLLVLSESNELLGITQMLPVVQTVRVFTSGIGALTQAYRIPGLVQGLNDALNAHRTETIVVLASHVWNPIIAPFLKKAGRRYVVIIHDAAPHPGDVTGLAYNWLLRDAAQADRLITLSNSVTTALLTKRRIPRERIVTLFHPLMTYVQKGAHTAWHGERPLRLLFFGRMMAYKGLPLFVSALDELRTKGLMIDVTVAGEGDLKGQKQRLDSLGVTVINRWLRDGELSSLLATHDAVVLTHIEASQSGCAAAALGAGLPVITTPVGGLVEQIAHEVNGLVADRVDAAAIARQITRMAKDPSLYRSLVQGVVRRGETCNFLDSMLDAIAPTVH